MATWSTPPQAIVLDGLSGELAALSFGNPANPKVFALHGWLDNAASFVPLAGLLEEFHIVAIDLPGHGRSAHRPRGTNYHLVDYVADVGHGVKSLGWDQFHLLGHSLGAGVSIVYAATFPEQIEKLVLIDGLGPTTGGADTASARLRKSIHAGLSAASRPNSNGRAYDEWNKLIGARGQASPISIEGAELLVRRGATEIDGAITVNSDRRLKHPSAQYLSEDVVLHFIRAVAAPTQLILARQGMVKNQTSSKNRIAAFSNLVVNEFEGQHHMHMDTPELISGDIRQFLV